MSGGLLTDLYELNMAASYLRRGMTDVATFSLFVRQLPPERGFLVAAGVDPALDWLERLCFEPDELAYLERIGFDAVTLEALARLRFTGDVWAVPEGRIVVASEPLLEVSAPIAEAQLAETFLLNQLTYHTTLASKAARCRVAAAGRVELVEFGFRRAHGVEAGMAAARLATLVGFAGTSNVEAARRFGLHPTGTMAHAYVEAFPTEADAFRAYAQDLPGPVTFLVDTYDASVGVGHAIAVIEHLGPERAAAVRIDSGDLVVLAHQARRMLDDAGLSRVQIFVSGGLDEHDVARLLEAGAPVDAVGIGTRLGVSADAPYLDSAYKLVAYGDRPVVKLSPGKRSLPGAKQVFRAPGRRDVLALRGEDPPPGAHALLEPVMRAGRRIAPPGDLGEARTRFETDLAELPQAALALRRPRAPEVAWSDALRQLVDATPAPAVGP